MPKSQSYSSIYEAEVQLGEVVRNDGSEPQPLINVDVDHTNLSPWSLGFEPPYTLDQLAVIKDRIYENRQNFYKLASDLANADPDKKNFNFDQHNTKPIKLALLELLSNKPYQFMVSSDYFEKTGLYHLFSMRRKTTGINNNTKSLREFNAIKVAYLEVAELYLDKDAGEPLALRTEAVKADLKAQYGLIAAQYVARGEQYKKFKQYARAAFDFLVAANLMLAVEYTKSVENRKTLHIEQCYADTLECFYNLGWYQLAYNQLQKFQGRHPMDRSLRYMGAIAGIHSEEVQHEGKNNPLWLICTVLGECQDEAFVEKVCEVIKSTGGLLSFVERYCINDMGLFIDFMRFLSRIQVRAFKNELFQMVEEATDEVRDDIQALLTDMQCVLNEKEGRKIEDELRPPPLRESLQLQRGIYPSSVTVAYNYACLLYKQENVELCFAELEHCLKINAYYLPALMLHAELSYEALQPEAYRKISVIYPMLFEGASTEFLPAQHAYRELTAMGLADRMREEIVQVPLGAIDKKQSAYYQAQSYQEKGLFVAAIYYYYIARFNIYLKVNAQKEESEIIKLENLFNTNVGLARCFLKIQDVDSASAFCERARAKLMASSANAEHSEDWFLLRRACHEAKGKVEQIEEERAQLHLLRHCEHESLFLIDLVNDAALKAACFLNISLESPHYKFACDKIKPALAKKKAFAAAVKTIHKPVWPGPNGGTDEYRSRESSDETDYSNEYNKESYLFYRSLIRLCAAANRSTFVQNYLLKDEKVELLFKGEFPELLDDGNNKIEIRSGTELLALFGLECQDMLCKHWNLSRPLTPFSLAMLADEFDDALSANQPSRVEKVALAFCNCFHDMKKAGIPVSEAMQAKERKVLTALVGLTKDYLQAIAYFLMLAPKDTGYDEARNFIKERYSIVNLKKLRDRYIHGYVQGVGESPKDKEEQRLVAAIEKIRVFGAIGRRKLIAKYLLADADIFNLFINKKFFDHIDQPTSDSLLVHFREKCQDYIISRCKLMLVSAVVPPQEALAGWSPRFYGGVQARSVEVSSEEAIEENTEIPLVEVLRFKSRM